jgi:predicted phage terminase large subunit-like protein
MNLDQLLASVCKESYFEFLKEFWDVIIPEKPHWNWHVKFLCDELQVLAERVFRGEDKAYDMIINISPGSTKSTIASVGYLPWIWTRMPNARMICGSHTHELVLDLSRKSRDIILSDKYKRLFPNIHLREDQNTKGYFVNTSGGMRFSCTVGGKTPTGMHGHFLVVDDPIDPMKAISELEIKSANAWMNETLPTRKVNKALTPTILIMQRLHQNDPSGNRLSRKEDRLRHICLPARLPPPEEGNTVFPVEARNNYVNGLMDPVRLPNAVLEESLREMGAYGFAGQYLQSPVPLGGGMFMTKRLQTGESPPTKFKRVIRYWDKAGSAGKGAYTVGVKMGLGLDGSIWILDVVRFQKEAAARERLIKDTAAIDGKKILIGVEQEPGSGGKESAESTVKNLLGYIVLIDIPKGDKVLRADPFSVQVNAGNVHLKEGLWNADYIEEMKYFPYSTYKDQIDASSGAFALLVKGRQRIGAF